MALTTFCSDDRYCNVKEEFERQKMCWEPAEPHSTLCEQHGGVAETESFLEEWEHWISDVEELCEHIDDGQDTVKVEAFKRGELTT